MKKEKIVPASSEADWETIQELAYTIWPSWYSRILSAEQIEYMLRELYNPEALKARHDAGERYFLLQRGTNPIGFFAVQALDRHRMKLEKLYLLEEERGQHLGRYMLAEAESLARNAGHTILTLNVNRFNSSFHFYEKEGYQIQTQVDIPFGPFVLNDFILEKHL
jgi:diamine N-acetyltransferase